jgi:spermidine synthase
MSAWRGALLTCCMLLGVSAHAAADTRAATPRVAIIGGGVGGTAAAHFLRAQLGEAVQLEL